MSVIYASLRLFLTLFAGLLHWRSIRAEIRYNAVTEEVEKTLLSHQPKADAKPDPLGDARRQAKLGAAAARQEHAEDVAVSACGWALWACGWRDWFAGKKGVVTPYVIALVDVAAVLITSERWGLATRTMSRVVSFVFTSDPGVEP